MVTESNYAKSAHGRPALGINMGSGHTIQVISRHEQFQTELQWELHIRDILRVLHLLVIVEVFADLLEHETAAAWLTYIGPASFRHALDVLEATRIRL